MPSENLSPDEQRIVSMFAPGGALPSGELKHVLRDFVASTLKGPERQTALVNRLASAIRRKHGGDISHHSYRNLSQSVIIEELPPLVPNTKDPTRVLAPPPSLGEIIDNPSGMPFEIVDQIGSGGMGAVYLVRDPVLCREAAQKVPHPNAPQELFYKEARLAAQLEHPALIPIYGFVKNDLGKTGLSMKLIKGKTLSDIVNAGEYSLNDRIRILIKICEGIAFMHDKNIIHRDLKPSNVMVGQKEFGEVYVFDLGLAKELGSKDFQTECEEGIIAGTLAYMPPEQAQARPDKRSDVYGIGAIAYELLVRVPFRTLLPGGADEVIAQKQLQEVLDSKGFVRFPGFFKDQLPRPLESVIKKALEPEVKRRYQSAEALRGDLQSFLDDKAVKAHSYSRRERVNRWIRHNPAKVVGGLALATFLTFGGIGYTWLASRARDAERESERQAIIARDSELKAVKASAEKDKAEAALSKERKEKLERAERRNRAQEAYARGLTYSINNPNAIEQAIVHFDKAIAEDDTHSEAYFWRGLSYFNLRKFEKALDDFTKSATIEPTAPIYSHRAVTYLLLDKPAEALADCETALKLDPDFGSAYMSRGHTRIKLGETKGAVEDFAMAAKKGHARGYLLAGKASTQLGNTADALKYFREYLKTGATEEREKIQRWVREREN